MKKYLNYKTIAIAMALLVIITGVFWLPLFSATSKKEIILENNYQTDDILSNSQPESENAEIIPEPEKIPEKTEGEIKKEPVLTEPPKNTNNSSPKFAIVDKLLSSGFEKSAGRTIDTIIIHSSYDALGADPFSVKGLIKEYESYGVSAHYLVDRGGTIYRLVEEKNIAYHAGVSSLPDGRTNVNETSIGIELMNTKDGNFTDKQYDSLNNLLKYIKGRYKIKYVLGHSQIAPGRKDDPWNFDWNKMD
ncbi:MAG: N-acetylmuramoyl-L-alanine amidase [Patescibacteria group bacterium]